MFGHSYFGASYFGPRYFGPAVAGGIIIPPDPPPSGTPGTIVIVTPCGTTVYIIETCPD